MKRLLVYSHDTFGLGNIRRMLAIAAHLVENDEEMSILIVSGSPMLHAFRIPPRIDYLKLPCLSRSVTGDYGVRFLDLPYGDTVRLRANVLLSAMIDFAPDLVLVDKKPLGVANELEPALELLQRRGLPTRCVLLLRDILDSPESTRAVWHKNDYFGAIDRFYDEVLVVGCEHVFDLAREYDFPQRTRQKLRYCGYLERRRPPGARHLRREFVGAGDRLVLVTAGGGEDGHRLVSTYAQGVADGELPADLHSVIVCGPEMAPARRRDISATLAGLGNVTLLEFTDDMLGLMEAADVVVSMAGYNTTCELLSLRKRAILVPRVEPVLEQWIRARHLARLGLVQAIHPGELTSGRLAAEVRSELDRQNVVACPAYRIAMDGLDRIAESVNTLLQARPAVASDSPERPRQAVSS